MGKRVNSGAKEWWDKNKTKFRNNLGGLLAVIGISGLLAIVESGCSKKEIAEELAIPVYSVEEAIEKQYKEEIEEQYGDEQIVDAIYWAEGGPKAKVPYGILSVPVKNEEEARQICLNTVRNNRKRYGEYGKETYGTFIDFLASRYAPVGAENDPNNLNTNWIRNVQYFLHNPKPIESTIYK